MRLTFLFLVFVGALNSFGQTSSGDKPITDQLNSIQLTDVRVGGEIGRRIAVTIENNLLLLDIDNDFLDSFRKKNDKGYIGIGKLIDGVVKMASYTNNEKVISLKNHLIGELVKWQDPDGYIGNMTPPSCKALGYS